MTFDEYELEADQFSLYPGRGTKEGLIYVALKMNGEAGEFAEHLGKAMRDDGEITQQRRELMIKEIGDVLWYLNAASYELGITLNEAAEINIRKLSDRAERGKLGGSGDNR